jgi:hypothetical protein
MCEDAALPLLVGADFNIIRRKEEKNNHNFNARWPFIFSAVIGRLDLRELVLSGRQFTWANRKEVPTFEKLDRVLASVSREKKIPFVSVRALTRAGSDHTPLIIDTGEQAHRGNKAHFSFELSWLKHEGFHEMIAREWAKISHGDGPMAVWQNKIHHLRNFLRGWAKNHSRFYKKEKERLLALIDRLDVQAKLHL